MKRLVNIVCVCLRSIGAESAISMRGMVSALLAILATSVFSETLLKFDEGRLSESDLKALYSGLNGSSSKQNHNANNVLAAKTGGGEKKLVVVNPTSLDNVSMSMADDVGETLKVTPLLVAELRNAGLDYSDNYDCIVAGKTAAGDYAAMNITNVRVPDAVVLPTFRYGRKGDVKTALTRERKIKSVSLNVPVPIFRSNVSAEERSAAYAKNRRMALDNGCYTYHYELPNGDLTTYADYGRLGLKSSRPLAATVNNAISAPDFEIVDWNQQLNFEDGTVAHVSAASTAAKQSIEAAAATWNSLLSIKEKIYVLTGFSSDFYEGDSSVLGSSFPPPTYTMSSTGVAYPAALVDQILGEDMHPKDCDITILYNAGFAFYFGTDGACPSTKCDFQSVVTHELCHGLGFSSYHGRGSDGEHPDGDWATDGNVPSIFDTFLYYSTGRLPDLAKSTRKAALTSNALYWDGANAKAANGNSRVKMYAPSTYNGGSSVSHWDEDVTFDTFMKWAIDDGAVHHEVDSRLKGAFKDMGWELKGSALPKSQAPTNLKAMDHEDPFRVYVSWYHPEEDATFYVYKNTKNEMPANWFKKVEGKSSLSGYGGVNDTDVQYDTTYYYWVVAQSSDAAYGPSDPVMVKISIGPKFVPPDAPVVTVTVTDRISLSWNSVGLVHGYRIYRSTDANARPQSAYKDMFVFRDLGPYEFVDEDVIAGMTYYYWVVAYLGAAEGNFAGPLEARVPVADLPNLVFHRFTSANMAASAYLTKDSTGTSIDTSFVQGEAIYHVFGVCNEGPGTVSKKISTCLRLADGRGNLIGVSDPVISSGSSYEKDRGYWSNFGKTWTTLQNLMPGTYRLTFVVDPDDEIEESNNDDNECSVDFTVTANAGRTYYVKASGGNDGNDGSSASSAFASIQKAIDSASDGDTIWVDDGVYAPIVSGNKKIAIRSLNGPGETMIDGASQNRCALLGSSNGETNTVLSGFTLMNGVSYIGGGAFGGTLVDCVLAGNLSQEYADDNRYGRGGGASYSVLERCYLVWNDARDGAGANECVLNNCIIGENSATQFGGATYKSTLNNCTIVGNEAEGYAGGCCFGELNNCIVWDNSAWYGSNAVWGAMCRYSCVDDRCVGGVGVIHDNPIFMRWTDVADGDYSLQPNSPCVNAGCDAYIVGDKDLNGEARVYGSHVDMGAFEWQGDYPDINLVFAKDEDKGWSSPVFLTTTRGGCEGMAEFAEGDVIYLYYGILNAASPVDVCNFKVRFTLNSTVTFDDDWTGYGVNGGTVGSFDEWRPAQLQSLAPGSYTLKCKIIAAEGVVETDTSDNEFTINFVVKSEQPEVYGITYENLGGATHNNPSTYEVGSTIVFAPPTERAGYTFTGWTPESITPSTIGEQIVTAGWRPNTYTIEFDANGGSGSMDSQTFTYDVGQNLRPNAFTREGYDFLGWAWTSTNEVPQFADGEAIKNLVEFDGCELTFFAVWSEIASSDPVPANYVTVSSSTYYGEGLAFPYDNIDYALTYANPSDADPISTLVISNVLDEAFDCTCAAVGSIVIAGERFDDLSGVMEGRDTFTLSSGVKVDVSIDPDVATRTVVWTFTASSSFGKGVLLCPGQTLVANYSACPCNVSGDDFVGYEIGTEVYFIADGGVPVYSETPCVNVIACQPDAPTGLSVSFNKNAAGNNYLATLTWNGDWPAGTKYVIYRSSSIIIDWDNPYAVTIDTSYTDPDEGLMGGATVYYAVCAWPEGPYIQGVGATTSAVVPTLPSVVATPVITPADGATFSGESCEVTITCATAGAQIYYTTNGVTPKTSSKYLYTGPFTVTDTVSIKAVAIKDGLTKSEYATATISKLAMTLERAIGATSEMIVTTGGDAEWQPVSDATVQSGSLSARSGLANDDDECESWLQVAVSGPGKLTFFAKTSCEHDDDGTCTWDRLMVYADDTEKLDMRMDGESGWKQKEIVFDAVGTHTVRWVYHKDESDYDGEDCAWVYGVVWTPSDADSIPELPPNPTSADVEAALVGSADARLQECITEPAEYNAYRAWASTVKAPGGSTAAGAQAVKDSPNAWLSFALDSATLIQNPPADGDVKVEKFEQTATAGAFDFTVGVENIPVGDDAKPGNLAKVFGIEGSSTLSPQDMSSDKVDITFGTPENGKVKFTAGPKDKTQPAFFMKVKIK